MGLREEREELRDLVPVIYRLHGMSNCFFLSVLIPASMPTYCPTTQHTSRCWPRPSLAACVDSCSVRIKCNIHSWKNFITNLTECYGCRTNFFNSRKNVTILQCYYCMLLAFTEDIVKWTTESGTTAEEKDSEVQSDLELQLFD